MGSFSNEDGNQHRYYVSDCCWRKAFSLMQTSAFLNGRKEINLTDYLLLIHSFWNDVDNILENSFSGGTDGEQMLAEAIRVLQKGDL